MLVGMAHYLDVFSPETHALFSASPQAVSGFRTRHSKAAARLKVGDLLVCYLTRLSRWVGLLEVTSTVYEDDTPIFAAKDDPFIVRVRVRPVVWLSPEQGIPIHAPAVWKKLSFTREHAADSTTWTGFLRTSLAKLDDDDAKLLERLLREQAKALKAYPLDDADRRALAPATVRRVDGDVVVRLPQSDPEPEGSGAPTETRESIKVQALVASIGARMGMKVWVPASDRAAIIRETPDVEASLLTKLPLNYDNVTLSTIENIDVLWLKGRSMARAFEVEHTTAIYSGILRMADLLALQPNMDIRLHIVAPEARREKVFYEIGRPVFSLIEGRPLAARCTFLSYDNVREVGALKHLEHVQDTVLDEYAEVAEG